MYKTTKIVFQFDNQLVTATTDGEDAVSEFFDTKLDAEKELQRRFDKLNKDVKPSHLDNTRPSVSVEIKSRPAMFVMETEVADFQEVLREERELKEPPPPRPAEENPFHKGNGK